MVDAHEELNLWRPDPLGRFEERYFVYGEPSRLVRTAGIESADPHGVEPTVQAPKRREISFVSLGNPRDRSTRVAWAVLAGLCIVAALAFLNIPLTATATTRDLSTVTVHCGSVVWPKSASNIGVANAASRCGSRRLPLGTVSLIFGVLALAGALRSIAVIDDPRTRLGEPTNGTAPVALNGNRRTRAHARSRRRRTSRGAVTDVPATN